MKEVGLRNPSANISELGFKNITALWNLSPEELIEHSIQKGMGVLNDTGALVVSTGEFTGRSPNDRFIVKDDITTETVDWNDINMPFSHDNFQGIKEKMMSYLEGKEVYVRDAYACADKDHKLRIRVFTELPWANMFASNMFLRPDKDQVKRSVPTWNVISIPSFHADPEEDGTRQHNFALISFTEQLILIGGTAYTGEIKKGIFSVLNFLLPHNDGVLPMHCSANVGKTGDTALYFGLSGTGKTTLSADPKRKLIGDDEHGWSSNGVFNFEGGCYAKCIDLSEEREPDIYHAIRHGAILENVKFHEGTRSVDYTNVEVTPNTRVSYPIHHIENIMIPSWGGNPKNIFFLTYDAFGVLPPIALLDKDQTMYQFISGYTSKVAGTEEGIVEPQTAFSACYGAPFMPLHPVKYAEMLGKMMHEYDVKVWLVNTGLVGGPYGVGKRMRLTHTRALISAALAGKFDHVRYDNLRTFNLKIPTHCPDVPDKVLNPRNMWEDKKEWDVQAQKLAKEFIANFKQFESQCSESIINAAPEVK